MILKIICCGILASTITVGAASSLLAQSSIVQRNSSRATVTGDNVAGQKNVAATSINQSAIQSGGSSRQPQTIEQYGQSSVWADGANNTAIGEIEQESIQSGGVEPQLSRQNATLNSRVTGRNNRAFSYTRQYSFQHQSR